MAHKLDHVESPELVLSAGSSPSSTINIIPSRKSGLLWKRSPDTIVKNAVLQPQPENQSGIHVKRLEFSLDQLLERLNHQEQMLNHLCLFQQTQQERLSCL